MDQMKASAQLTGVTAGYPGFDVILSAQNVLKQSQDLTMISSAPEKHLVDHRDFGSGASALLFPTFSSHSNHFYAVFHGLLIVSNYSPYLQHSWPYMS
jgi:hypothetical protein